MTFQAWMVPAIVTVLCLLNVYANGLEFSPRGAANYILSLLGIVAAWASFGIYMLGRASV